MTWNDRAVRTADEAEVSYAIDEVYDDTDVRLEACTERPSYPAGETPEELCQDVQHELAVLDQAVLDNTRFGRAGDAPFGIDEEGCPHDPP
jgi:hypothetical protein